MSEQNQNSQVLPGWYALCPASTVRTKPIRRFLAGKPIVIWRHAGGISSAWDICPHRGAPLSEGWVKGDQLVCPYHGWRYAADGACAAMPALSAPVGKVALGTIPTREVDDLIFVGMGPGTDQEEPAPSLLGKESASVIIEGEVETTLADLAENILDTTHTSVVHRGYLRPDTGQRRVRPEVEAGKDWIQVTYPPDAAPRGVLGLFSIGKSFTITDRFRAPGVAEVEYKDQGKSEFAAQFFLRPVTSQKIAALARVQVPGNSILSKMKVAIARIALEKIFSEDRVILTAVARNQNHFEPGRKSINAPQDLLRPGIEKILEGHHPRAPETVPELWI